MRPDEFGGACRAAAGGGCRFQPNATRHNCPESDLLRWQCAASKVAHDVVAAAMREAIPAKISPDHLDSARAARGIIALAKETTAEYHRLPAAARLIPTRRISLSCRHMPYTYDIFRVLDYLRDVTAVQRPDLSAAQARELDEAHRAGDARRVVRAVEATLPERDLRVLRVRLGEWAELVSREPVPGNAGTYGLVRSILDELALRRPPPPHPPPPPPPPPHQPPPPSERPDDDARSPASSESVAGSSAEEEEEEERGDDEEEEERTRGDNHRVTRAAARRGAATFGERFPPPADESDGRKLRRTG